jgi:osmoprotectant transport system ATP-binding protein
MPISLAARNVSHHFGNVVALDGVTIDVPAGRAVALVGESGSGKTTLLRCFNRLVEPQQGEVLVGDRNVRAQPAVQLRRGIGYVQQHGGLLPHWRVLRNVALVPVLQGMSDPLGAAREALELVGLPSGEFGARFPHELSGGQRQRVALARALAHDPQLLICDEILSALDVSIQAQILELLLRLRRESHLALLFISHDMAVVQLIADRVAVMVGTGPLVIGTCAEIFDRHAPAGTSIE